MKKCTKCKQLKELKEFNKDNHNKKTGLAAYCRECVKKCGKEYYKSHILSHKNKAKDYKKKSKQWFIDYKSTLKCSQCNENHPSCLEFHHLNPKLKENGIAKMVSNNVDKKLILKEIEKCIILCSNCHKKLHYNFEYSLDIENWK